MKQAGCDAGVSAGFSPCTSPQGEPAALGLPQILNTTGLKLWNGEGKADGVTSEGDG